MVDGNKLGDVGFEKIGTPYKEMDCQKFYEWCLAKCGYNKDLGGSNSWYRYILEHGRILTPEECVRELGCVPKGATLFIHAFDGKEPEKFKKDGLGNASHMGICTMPRGEGAINSSESRGGVCESKFKGKSINGGWNAVGLPDFVLFDYGGGGIEPTPEPTPSPEPEETAIVIAQQGKNVNMRTNPSTSAPLVERVPLGETVTVLTHGEDWCKIKWKWKVGWMMSKFLLFDNDVPIENTYTVTITKLTREEADSLVLDWGEDRTTISVG